MDLGKSQSRLTSKSVRMFSTEEPAEKDIKEEFEEITEEEKQKYRDAWGMKFNDECIKFEKEWEQIAETRSKEQMAALSEELSEYQKRKVNFIADKILEFNTFEMRYLAAITQERVQKTTGINPLKLNMDWPSVKMDADGTWPPLNPNWFKQQELMSQIGPLMGGFGGGAAPVQEGGEEAPAEEEKKEAEKDSFDVELSGFDAKKKIKLIKEIRGLFSLGLKEAKEMVEGAPVWLKKGVKKDEADELVEKLAEFGAEVKIV